MFHIIDDEARGGTTVLFCSFDLALIAATREETITAFKDSVDSGLIGWTNHSESIFGVRDSRPEVRSVNVAFVPFGITP